MTQFIRSALGKAIVALSISVVIVCVVSYVYSSKAVQLFDLLGGRGSARGERTLILAIDLTAVLAVITTIAIKEVLSVFSRMVRPERIVTAADRAGVTVGDAIRLLVVSAVIYVCVLIADSALGSGQVL